MLSWYSNMDVLFRYEFKLKFPFQDKEDGLIDSDPHKKLNIDLDT